MKVIQWQEKAQIFLSEKGKKSFILSITKNMEDGNRTASYYWWVLRLLEKQARLELDEPVGCEAIRFSLKNELRLHMNDY